MGSWRLTLDDNRTEWSDGIYAIHDLPVGRKPSREEALQFYPEADRLRLNETLSAAVDSGESFELEVDFATANGGLKRVRCMGESEKVGDKTIALVGVLHDITARHVMERELLRISRTDDLTGLANRVDFNRVLDERLTTSNAAGEDVAVLLIDLDGFKALNDKLGHAMGDEGLRRVGKHLRGATFDGCFSARLGGDEFAMIVPGSVGPAAFQRLVDRLLADLRLFIGEPGRILSISGTIGCAWSSDAPRGRESLMRCADEALYTAKRTRKGTACIYAPPERLAKAI